MTVPLPFLHFHYPCHRQYFWLYYPLTVKSIPHLIRRSRLQSPMKNRKKPSKKAFGIYFAILSWDCFSKLMAGLLFLTLAILSSSHPHWLILAIIFHEAGHFLTAKALRWEHPRFQMNGIGIKLLYGSFHSTNQTLLVLFSGCVLGLICAVIPLFPKEFRLFSLGLSSVNLLPISVLDGGEILSVILEYFFPPHKAYRITRVISILTVICLWVLCCAVQLKAGINLTLLAVSVYLTVSVLTHNSHCYKTK